MGTVNFESLVFETEVTFNGYTIAHHTQKVCALVADLKTPGDLLIERYLAWTAVEDEKWTFVQICF